MENIIRLRYLSRCNGNKEELNTDGMYKAGYPCRQSTCVKLPLVKRTLRSVNSGLGDLETRKQLLDVSSFQVLYNTVRGRVIKCRGGSSI